jgi:hypothetical protein
MRAAGNYRLLHLPVPGFGVEERLGRFAGVGGVFLEREDVIQDALDPSALEPVIGDQAGVAEQFAELQTECRVDAELAAFQGFLEHHQAEVEDLEAMPALQGLVHSLKT